MRGRQIFPIRIFSHKKTTVLILDAMDEREIADEGDRNFNRFIAAVNGIWLKEINTRSDNSRLHLIFTGRSQFFFSSSVIFLRQLIMYSRSTTFQTQQIDNWLERFNKSKNVDLNLPINLRKNIY